MEEHFYWPRQTADASPPKGEPAQKSNELRVVEALESIASEMFHIRQHLEGLTDGGYGDALPAIRTTGR